MSYILAPNKEMLTTLLTFCYERTGFACAHILSYAELTLAYAYHSFAYATALQGAPCLTWTQGFKTWLTWKHATTSAQPRGWPRSLMIATPKMIRWKPWDWSMKGKHQPYIIHSILEMCVLSFLGTTLTSPPKTAEGNLSGSGRSYVFRPQFSSLGIRDNVKLHRGTHRRDLTKGTLEQHPPATWAMAWNVVWNLRVSTWMKRDLNSIKNCQAKLPIEVWLNLSDVLLGVSQNGGSPKHMVNTRMLKLW